MKSTSIKLNDSVSIDLPKLIETRLLVQANSGGGKSYAIRRIVEQAFGKVQIIILDPEGEFTNLRERYDFVYAGKGGDAAVESRSAAKLAEKLLELKASTIIDLYELPPQERKHFVRLFCEAMVNSPKELWHDTLIIIDEAHVFAPEKGESEAMGPVIDLATRGRKRGYCVVLATQRLPKLNKDAAAECNNKLIGRASQDIDRKRAADELGFTTREQILSLRDLDPGEFYAFGPAISREVIKIKIGEVKVVPPKRGSARSFKAPPPSAAVKRILGALKDIPQEAEKEARTARELQVQNSNLIRENRELKKVIDAPRSASAPDPDAIKRLTDKAYSLGVSAAAYKAKEREKEWHKLIDKWDMWAADVINFVCLTQQSAEKMYAKRGTRPPRTIEDKDYPLPRDFLKMPVILDPKMAPGHFELVNHGMRDLIPPRPIVRSTVVIDEAGDVPARVWDKALLGKGEREILNAIAQDADGMTTEHIAVMTGYKQTSRRVYLQRLTAGGYVAKEGESYLATPAGIAELGSDYKPLPSSPQALREHVMATLPDGEKKVLSAIMNEGSADKSYIEFETGYKATSVRVYLQRLAARKLIVMQGGKINLSDKLK